MTTLAEALAHCREALAGLTESPRLDAELLLCAAAGISRTTLMAWPERTLAADQRRRLQVLLARRSSGEPMAYILGQREFWDLTLRVGPGVLVPRPDTERLVEATLAALPVDAALTCVDLGTGSGAVACALARERPAWTLIAIEHAAPALAIAADNARRLGLGNLQLLRGDWLDAIAPRSLDAIVSNPPYVCADDPHLARGDLQHEPITALAAGADGLDAIRRIVADAPRCLRPGGWLALEHGWDQGPSVRALLHAAGLRDIRTQRDLAGHERVTSGRT
ncbi:peptide chain release factor N(5)-glutamine methyltransferase [Thiohalocapsa marina]|uniref:Release factor glutamine methyltransferase n=1 Tax=Thiohalocapsa marina TaxID=424902 RepID=A0A5M8FLB6_9GAMM|nr:peptide chain release factor N(5)-glutamine methyltransferase [Thiohalocapsa marina]KAA6183235.1 peptide chain release factor N(5)-glutamine methyltransferase [Thiohalocapsa marina]